MQDDLFLQQHSRRHFIDNLIKPATPAYDINPVYSGRGLTLNISETDNSLDLDLARSVSGYFRLNEKKSELIIETVQAATAQWRKFAKLHHIPRAEQDLMEQAFIL
jgi:serine/threonine-protein kinase HipA